MGGEGELEAPGSIKEAYPIVAERDLGGIVGDEYSGGGAECECGIVGWHVFWFNHDSIILRARARVNTLRTSL